MVLQGIMENATLPRNTGFAAINRISNKSPNGPQGQTRIIPASTPTIDLKSPFHSTNFGDFQTLLILRNLIVQILPKTPAKFLTPVG
jgi:hypothetical protein